MEIVKIKSFFTEQEARLYEARLKEAGIPSFVSDANTITAIPLGAGGIGLHVRLEDVEAASLIVEKLDLATYTDNADESFHEADYDDIEYQRSLNKPVGSNWWLIWVFVLVAILLIWQFYNA